MNASNGIDDLLWGIAGALFLAICIVSIGALALAIIRQITAIEGDEKGNGTRRG